jgi:hypothetical protein
MEELRRLWFMLDNNNIHIKPQYIRSAASTWADEANRHMDSDDLHQDPTVFHEIESEFSPHMIDRYASALNTLFPCYNANWLDQLCEAVDVLHLSDAHSRDENKWCNPPWPLLPDLAQELLQIGAAATLVAPRSQ